MLAYSYKKVKLPVIECQNVVIFMELPMKKSNDRTQIKRMNVFGLMSGLLFLLVFPLLLIPWRR